jgi:diguanylate cyclase (GGDEF)-like protein
MCTVFACYRKTGKVLGVQMLNKLVHPVRESFSAKIIALVSASVLVTSIVVGLVTIRSTKRFLTQKTSEKFPSVLNTSQSKVKIFYERQFNSIRQLSLSRAFTENLDEYLHGNSVAGGDTAAAVQLEKYLSIVHNKFPIYEELIVVTTDGEKVVGTIDPDDMAESEDVVDLFEESFGVARMSKAMLVDGDTRVVQWLILPVQQSDEGPVEVLMLAKIDLCQISDLLDEIQLGKGGELFVLDERGRYLTQPRFATEPMFGKQAMQVPTRDTGEIKVVKRKSYEGRTVFSSIAGLDETGWWLAYEEDYKSAMAPVLKTQTRIWVAVLLIGGIFILVALKIVQSMMKPVHELKLGAERINEGLVGVNIPRGSNDEIGMMIDTFNEMAKTITLSKAELQYKNKVLNSQNDQLQSMNQKLEELSITDGLTGLFNHRHFWNIMNTELSRVDLYQGDLALLLIDIDDFKRVNDQFGHAVGDLLLQSISRVLKDSVRDTDIVARYGGEEFAVLLPDTDKKGVQNVSEKLRTGVEGLRFQVPETDISISVTISVGVSAFRGNRREFFNAADRALYVSKSEGKNRVNYALQA